MIFDSDAVEALIAEFSEDVERKLDWLEAGRVPEDRLPFVFGRLSGDFRSLGALYHLVGERESGREAFGNAGTLACKDVRAIRQLRDDIEKSEWESEPIALRDGLYAAILSRDADVRQDVIELVGSMDSVYVEEFADMVPFYYFVRCLAGLVQDEDISGELTRFEESLSEFDGGLRERYAGLLEVLRGFESGEVGRIEAGLEAVLAVHERELDSDVGQASRVCLSVWALRDFARERGLEVVVGSEFVPESVGDGGE